MVPLAALLFLHSAQLGWRAGTPEPVLAANPRWVQLYWKAWENTQKHVLEEESPGPFPSRFIAGDGRVAFDESVALSLYERWAWRAAPCADTLSYVLSQVDTTGAVAEYFPLSGGRSISEAKGLPLAGLAAQSLFQISGDKSFLQGAFSSLMRRHAYVEDKYSEAPLARPPNEAKKQTKPRSRKRNVPIGFSILPGPPTDLQASAEAIALCLQDSSYLRKAASALGFKDATKAFDGEVTRDVTEMLKAWNEELRAFSGLDKNGKPAERRSLIPIWSLIGGSLPETLTSDVARALNDPRQFFRRTLYPLLPFSDAAYDPSSGVRPLYEYLTLRALMDSGQWQTAGRAAESMLKAYESSAGEELKLYNDYGPETRKPAPNVQPDSLEAGLIVIAGLIESVIGIEADAPKNEVRWHIRRLDRHGLLKLRMADNTVSVVCIARHSGAESPVVEVDCEKPFTLAVFHQGQEYRKRFVQGHSVWKIVVE